MTVTYLTPPFFSECVPRRNYACTWLPGVGFVVLGGYEKYRKQARHVDILGYNGEHDGPMVCGGCSLVLCYQTHLFSGNTTILASLTPLNKQSS